MGVEVSGSISLPFVSGEMGDPKKIFINSKLIQRKTTTFDKQMLYNSNLFLNEKNEANLRIIKKKSKAS